MNRWSNNITGPNAGGARPLPMHRLFLGLSLACFVTGSVCFGVFFVRTACLIVQMPSFDFEQVFRHVARTRTWGWWSLGLYSVGVVILWCLPGRTRSAEAKPAGGTERRDSVSVDNRTSLAQRR